MIDQHSSLDQSRNLNLINSFTKSEECPQSSITLLKKQATSTRADMTSDNELTEEQLKKRFKCQQCDKRFHKQNKLNRHIKDIHEHQRPYVCDYADCDVSFKRKDHLDRHKVSCHASYQDRQKLKCPHVETGCLMTFPNRDQLRKHIKRKHEKTIVCQHCIDKIQQQLDDQTIDQTKFDELACKYTFNKKNQLKKHLLEVHDEGWFICEEHCGKKFKSQKLHDAHLVRIKDIQDQKRMNIYEFQSNTNGPIGSIGSQEDKQSQDEIGEFGQLDQKPLNPEEDIESLHENQLIKEIIKDAVKIRRNSISDLDFQHQQQMNKTLIKSTDEVESVHNSQKGFDINLGNSVKSIQKDSSNEISANDKQLLCNEQLFAGEKKPMADSLFGMQKNHLANPYKNEKDSLYPPFTEDSMSHMIFDKSINTNKSLFLMKCNYCGMIQTLNQTSRAFYSHIRNCKRRHQEKEKQKDYELSPSTMNKRQMKVMMKKCEMVENY